MMTGDVETAHTPPSDFDQMRIVWKYEILKYLRSKRLVATLAIVSVVLALMYLLPPALGEGFSGTDADVRLLPIPTADPGDASYYALINRSYFETDTLRLSVDGEPYPSADGVNWVFDTIKIEGSEINAVFFMQPEDIVGADVTASYDWRVSPESFAGNSIFFVGILIMIISVLFAADSLVGEFQNRTGYLIFPNAIKRVTLFAGKFMASITVGMAVIALFYVVVAALSMISADGVDDDFLVSFCFAAGYLLAAMGIGYFISAIMKSSVGAIVLTLLLLLLIIPIVDGFSAYAGVKVEGSVTFAAGAISYVLMDPYPEDTIMYAGGIEFHNFYPTPSTAAIVLIAYAAVTCILSAVIFKRKQLAG